MSGPLPLPRTCRPRRCGCWLQDFGLKVFWFRFECLEVGAGAVCRGLWQSDRTSFRQIPGFGSFCISGLLALHSLAVPARLEAHKMDTINK